MGQHSDHIEGFSELLEADGRTLQHSEEDFRALVRTVRPPEESFDLSPTDNDAVEVTAFRDEIPDPARRVGAHLQDAEGVRYRVTRLRRSTNRALVKLECVVLHP